MLSPPLVLLHQLTWPTTNVQDVVVLCGTLVMPCPDQIYESLTILRPVAVAMYAQQEGGAKRTRREMSGSVPGGESLLRQWRYSRQILYGVKVFFVAESRHDDSSCEASGRGIYGSSTLFGNDSAFIRHSTMYRRTMAGDSPPHRPAAGAKADIPETSAQRWSMPLEDNSLMLTRQRYQP